MKPSNRLRRPFIPTLAAIITRYVSEVSIRKKGAEAERSIARVWLGTRLAGRPIDRIRNTDLIELRDEWLKDKAAATVVRRLAFLSHVFTVLRKDWGWTELANPAQLVRRPSVADSRDRRIFDQIKLRGVSEGECPRNELQWIIQSSRSLEMPTIAVLASETSMRRSEICGIYREHIDLVHGVVKLFNTKNGTSREVPLSPFAKETLRVYLTGKPLRGKVFTMAPGSVTRAFIRARQRAREKYESLCSKYGRRANPSYFIDLRLHDLRHESTSVLATIFDPHDMAKINGQKDLRMVMRYYHPRGRELAQKLARSPRGRRQLATLKAQRLEQRLLRHPMFDIPTNDHTHALK
ncbi:tyrosine-type recombinase/integrase [Herminiimonas contaminans]|uniref:Tyrosine-type recombinase/integrase n=1 Tax=Herminiimonas contaminans TaxID=1111140 RepID=A0ABS0EPZ7_9BURK|nr:tyrosine-type recombinase/integrase [Herminiimonas contaminans]MBF8176935.1 tyrosine-type recombinase/integrase [Herminiimonas contaminans]